MRLAFKITLFFIGGICLVMAWHGWTSIERETELFESQMRRDHYSIARPLALMVGRAWDEFGEGLAFELVESANDADDQVRVRWVWTEAGGEERIRPGAPVETGSKLADGMAMSWIDRDQIHAGRLYTYVPVVLEQERIGALEISESFERKQAYLDDTRWHLVQTTLLILVLAAAMAWLTGLLFVARPVEALIERARGIGRGELRSPLKLEGHGELSQLAREMNLMSDQLALTREQLEEESEARLAALRQLRHADRLKTVGTLAAGIAHELGTPLNVILMRARMIAEQEVEGESARQSADAITDQTERISGIIEQLMDFARVRSLQKVELAVVQVVEQAVGLVEPIAQNKGVEVELGDCDSTLKSEIDADQFTQVLTNLLVNGMHACEDEGGRVEVEVGSVERIHPEEGGEEMRTYVEVSVSDNGHGIEEEELEQVFEPFFTTKDVGEGTGLGLSVSYGIAREHGGWIEVESEAGQGSTFRVIVPIRQNEERA